MPADFRNIWPAKVAFAQFHQEGASPAIMIQNDRGGLWLDIHDAGGTVAMLPLLADSDLRGRWHDIVLHVGWSRGADGFIEAEVNGRPPVIWHGPTMWAADVYFKFGLYRSHLERNAAGRLVTQRVYFDRLRRAASRETLHVSPWAR